MPDLGQLRFLQGDPFVLLNVGSGLLVNVQWVNLRAVGLCPCALEQIGSLGDGAVLDPTALLRRGEVVVVSEAPHRLDNETFDALIDMAEGRGE